MKSNIICLKKIFKKKKFVVVVKKYNSTNKIVEKIGTYDTIHKKLSINIYRLIFFVSKQTRMTGALFVILKRFHIFNQFSFRNLKKFKKKKKKRYIYKKKNRAKI